MALAVHVPFRNRTPTKERPSLSDEKDEYVLAPVQFHHRNGVWFTEVQ